MPNGGFPPITRTPPLKLSGGYNVGFFGALNQSVQLLFQQQMLQAEKDRQLQQGIFTSLLNSKDPRVVALAIAGIKEPRHFKDLLGLGNSPEMEQLSQILGQAMPKEGGGDSAAGAATIAPPTVQATSPIPPIPPPDASAPAAQPVGALNTPAQAPANGLPPSAASGLAPGQMGPPIPPEMAAGTPSAAPMGLPPTQAAPPTAPQGTTVEVPGAGQISTPHTSYDSMISQWSDELAKMKAEFDHAQMGGPLGMGNPKQTGISQNDISTQNKALAVLKAYKEAGKPFDEGFRAAMSTLSSGVLGVERLQSAEDIAKSKLESDKAKQSERMEYLNRSLAQRKQLAEQSQSLSLSRTGVTNRNALTRAGIAKEADISGKYTVDMKTLDSAGTLLDDLQGRLKDFMSAREEALKNPSLESVKKAAKNAYGNLVTAADAYSRPEGRAFGDNRISDKDADAYKNYLTDSGTWDAIDPTVAIDRLNAAVIAHNNMRKTVSDLWHADYDAVVQAYQKGELGTGLPSVGGSTTAPPTVAPAAGDKNTGPPPPVAQRTDGLQWMIGGKLMYWKPGKGWSPTP